MLSNTKIKMYKFVTRWLFSTKNYIVYISIFFYFIAVIGTVTVSTACLVLLGGYCEPGFISVKQQLFSFSFNSVVITPIIDPEGLLVFLLFILFSNFVSSLVKYLVNLKRESSERKKRTVGDLRILVCESTDWGMLIYA